MNRVRLVLCSLLLIVFCLISVFGPKTIVRAAFDDVKCAEHDDEWVLPVAIGLTASDSSTAKRHTDPFVR